MANENLSQADLAALELAIETARRDPAERKRIDDWLAKGDDRMEVARQAAYHCQIARLEAVAKSALLP